MKAYKMTKIKLLLVLVALVGLGSILQSTPTTTAAPHTFTVNSTASGFDANPGDNICQTANPGECTLTAAIAEANENGNPNDQDVINFNIPGSGPHTITVSNVYDSFIIYESVFIDGYSQPGAQANTNPNPQPFNGTLKIEIDGTDATWARGVFTLYSDNVKLSGLAINRGRGAQVLIGGDNIELSGNYLGTDITGMIPRFSPDIVDADGAAFDIAGGDNLKVGGPDPADRNVLVSNAAIGINGIFNSPNDPDSPANTVVQGNNFYVGSDSVTPLPPVFTGYPVGVTLSNLRGVTFGGDNAGEGNIVENTTGIGILIDASTDNAIVAGNRIVGNGGYSFGQGIAVNEAHDVRIGGTSQYSRNIIADNSGDGINIANSENLSVLGNYIGVHDDGITALENGGQGIYVNNSSNIAIGSSTAGGRNVISGLASRNGISIDNNSDSITIQNNALGIGADETTALTNQYGIYVNNSTQILIGGTGADEGNIITESANDGIALAGPTQNTTILGNKIYANGGHGIDLGDNGVTYNDQLDPDTGPNTLLNYPVVYTPVVAGGNTDVMYGVDVPAGYYRIEFFSNTAADGSGYGEGESFITSRNITSNGAGLQLFNATIPGTSFTNIRATATLIDASTPSGFGPTSEFGNLTTPSTDIAMSKAITNLADVAPGGLIEYDLSFINEGPFPAQLADFSDFLSGERLFMDISDPDLIPADEGVSAGLPGSFMITDTGNADVSCAWLGPGSAGSVFGFTTYSDYGITLCWYSGTDTVLASGDSLDVHLRFNVDGSSGLNISNYALASLPQSTSDPDDAAMTSGGEEDLLDGDPAVNNLAVANTTGGEADLAMTKSLQDPDDFVPGGTITYELAVTNDGPSWYDPTLNNNPGAPLMLDFVPPDITPINLGGAGPYPGTTWITNLGNSDVACLWGPHGAAVNFGAIDHPDYGVILCQYIGSGVIKNGDAISIELSFQIANNSSLTFNNYAFTTVPVPDIDPDMDQVGEVYTSGNDILTGLAELNVNNFAIAQPPVDIGVTASLVNPQDVGVGKTIYYDVTLLNRGPAAVNLGFYNSFNRGLLGGIFAADNLDIIGSVTSGFLCPDGGPAASNLGAAVQDHPGYNLFSCIYNGSGQILAAGQSQTVRLAFTVTDPAAGFNFYALNISSSTDPDFPAMVSNFLGATSDVLDTFTNDNFARVVYQFSGGGSTSGSGSSNGGSGLSETGQNLLRIIGLSLLLIVGAATAFIVVKRQQKTRV